MIPTIAGTLGFLLAPKEANVGRLICFYLTGSYQASFVLSLSLITSNTGGQTKKMLTSAVIWLGACVGNIAGPFFYKTQQAPSRSLPATSHFLQLLPGTDDGRRLRVGTNTNEALDNSLPPRYRINAVLQHPRRCA